MPAELNACDRYRLLARNTARALCVIQRGPVEAVRLSCLKRTLASLLNAPEMSVLMASLGP